MTPGKIKLVAQYYYDYLVQAGVEPRRSDVRIERAAWCAQEIINLVAKGEYDKANRWLGFVQGVLFSLKIFEVDDLRDHSRKDSPMARLNEPFNTPEFTEKERRIYYQDIVYAVCNQLERIYPQKIVCGTVEMPTNEVQETMTRLANACNIMVQQ